MISPTRFRCHEATLITGLVGVGKTYNLVDRLLKTAASHRQDGANLQPGSLLTIVGTRGYDCVQGKVDLHRPLGCRSCNITTFPALVQAIVHDHGPGLGIYAGSKRMLERVELSVFLHRHLDHLRLGRYEPTHSLGDAVRPILDLFTSLVHCGVDPNAYLDYVASLETELDHATEGGKLRDSASHVLKDRRMQMEAEAWFEKVAGERDKANAYKAFEELKKQEEVVDYGDLLLLARRILVESASARADLSLRLSHVFVDDLHEYSPAMMDVLKHVVSDQVGITATADPFLEAWSASRNGRNAFGPGCCPIALFKRAFPETVEIHLPGSRGRSDAVVQAMGTLRPLKKDPPLNALSSERSQPAGHSDHQPGVGSLEQGQDGVPDRTDVGSGENEMRQDCGRVNCKPYMDEEQEMVKLGETIQQLVCQGVNPGDIGVIVLGGSTSEARVVASLAAAGLPVEPMRRYSTMLQKETPRTLMSLLRCLVHPSESPPLLHLLMHCPAYALPEGDLAVALEGHMSRYVPLRTFLQDLGRSNVECKELRGVSDAARAVAVKLLADMDRYGEMSKRCGVREVMLAFLRDTGQLKKLQEPGTQEEELEGLAVAVLFDVVRMAEKQVEHAFLGNGRFSLGWCVPGQFAVGPCFAFHPCVASSAWHRCDLLPADVVD